MNGEAVPLELDAAASYIDGRHYRVTGKVRFGDDEPVPFAGEVNGRESEVYVQISPPQPTELTAAPGYGGRTWELHSSPPFSTATLLPAGGASGYPYGPNFSFELARVP